MAIDENGVVTFTPEEQAAVDKIVGERLGREKGKYADYEDLKELVPLIQEFGYQGTPAEIKAELRAEAEGRRKQAELEALKEEAKETGSSPELLAEIRALKAEMAEIKADKTASKQESEAKAKAEADWNKQVADFEEQHPDVDLPKLAANKDFMEYLEGASPALSISQNYERFVKFYGKASADAVAKLKSNIDRSTSSGRSKSDAGGSTHGLTDRQQQLAAENGLSNKEYAEYLKEIQ